MYARSEQTLFFVGASAQDLKHAYAVLRINLDKMMLEPWQRGAHEMSAAVRAVKVCSALCYLYRAHALEEALCVLKSWNRSYFFVR